MKLFHQTGHNLVWNIESLIHDDAGNGLIISPQNIEFDKLIKLDDGLLQKSFIDPQLYIINDNKRYLSTYEYFPENIKSNHSTADYTEYSNMVAEKCIDLQIECDFSYLIIPTRHYDIWPSQYYEKHYESIIEPFTNYISKKGISKKTLITLIVKKDQIIDETKRIELLNWITGINGIDGIYLLLENNYSSKQIKDSEYLYEVLRLIYFLKQNDLEVHIGYCNIEGYLYSLAGLDSISMGSYENLRKFNIQRFVTPAVRRKMSQPNARLYSSSLLQCVEYGYLGAFHKLYSKKINDIFEDSKYKPLMFKSGYNWNFQKPEPYKHFFLVYSQQINKLPIVSERLPFIKEKIKHALDCFTDIKDSGIILDENSDGSHLTYWLTSVNMFEAFLKENG